MVLSFVVRESILRHDFCLHHDVQRFMNRLFLPCTLLFVLLLNLNALAQPKLKLQRTTGKGVPIVVKIYSGYNGVSDPSDLLQDKFENTFSTTWGGVVLGLQIMMRIDTVGVPFGAGLDFSYQRMVNRNLAKRPEVRYVDSPDSTAEVKAEEELHAYMALLFVDFEVIPRINVQVGGGFQYLYAKSDVVGKVTGLFETTYVPVISGALCLKLLANEHGSINFDLRCVRGFGDYGSFHIQSLLAFNFNF